MRRNLISILLSIAMVISIFPTSGIVASASEELIIEQNVALGKTVTGSSANLVDGKPDYSGIADWTDFSNDKFVEVDLANTYDVTKAYIYKRLDGEGPHPVSIWGYSEKKTSLSAIINGDGLIGTIDANTEKATFNLQDTKTARYIYLTSTDKTYVGFFELEVYAIAPIPVQTYYVSSSGSDSNSGLSASAPTTFAVAKAAAKDNIQTEIVMLDSMDWVSMADAKGYVKIKGNTSGLTLTFSSNSLPMYASVEFSNLELAVPESTTFYANGKRFKIDENCTTTNRISVYGGGGGSVETYTSTELILLGGNYLYVHGGGMGVINGDTNIIFGGNANKDDSINESSSAYSPTYIFGSCNGGVSGSTNITIKDNAVARYICGAYRTSAAAPTATNITIKDNAKVMNVYGATDAASDTDVYALSIDRVTINMEGGDVESIFGGSYGANLTGNVFINWEGGNIRRRLYTGCYNNYTRSGFSMGYKTSAYVQGTTTLSISGNGTMSTANLDSGNNNNTGIYPGSRYSAASNTEHNTIIYQNGCYDSAISNYNIVTTGEKQKIPIIGSITTSVALGGYIDYTIKSSLGGRTEGTSTEGTVYLAGEDGRYGIINGVGYLNQNAAISTGTTQVSYDYNFKVNSTAVSATDTATAVNANISANNFTGESEPYAICAIYDRYGKFMGCDLIDTSASTKDYDFSIDAALTTGETYTMKIMIWDSKQTAIVDVYTAQITR